MKKTIAIITVILTLAVSVTALAADKVTYTFKGNNVITDGSPNDITDVPLTDNITVTTSGDMNRKYVGITDLKHNNEVGTFPAHDTFKATGSYLYLACANANDNAIITLNMPAIAKGSKVAVTFAKPVVTNNGSTLRNTNDPYAYLKIADRYISINGDNFDAWRTESVVTGEDTSEMEFHCDKWGAVAISKIEITGGDKTALHALNISSTQYANLNVNGIKFCADENGNITIPSYPEGENITVTAYKDGYKTAEKSLSIGKADASVSIPLECESDAVYYESDFGNTAGTLALDGEYKFGDGISVADVTKIFGRVTFSENGYLRFLTPTGHFEQLTYTDGEIRADEGSVTHKDNMEFEIYLDRKNHKSFLVQNDEYTMTANLADVLTGLEGKNVTIDYIGVSYPDTSKITIEGPDQISSLPDTEEPYGYTITPEYLMPDSEILVSVSDGLISGNDGVWERPDGVITVKPDASGKASVTASYNGASVTKEIEIVKNPKISSWQHSGNTLNLHSSRAFVIDDVADEYGNPLPRVTVKDFKSSDENVITITGNGIMTAVGKGTAAITANVYTGEDNLISVAYTVDSFSIRGVTEDTVSYAVADIVEDDNISAYRVSFADGRSEKIEKTQIPASTVKADGLVLTAYYDRKGNLKFVRNDRVKKGDKIPASNGLKRVYLFSGNTMTRITDADAAVDGFEMVYGEGVEYEIAPAYVFNNIGDAAEGKTLDGVFEDGYYNMTFQKAETKRGDIFVNGYMVGNNVDQSDADRRLVEGSLYTAEDIKVKNGEITVSMTDGSTLLDNVIITKQPYFYQRPRRVYIIGDSLVCNYYGDFEKVVGGGRTGWGQVIGDFLNVPVTNLANSGQFAKGLYETAFPSVIANGQWGDICLIECGYNDRSYSTREEMEECVKKMIYECREAGITPILVTPNASEHDYKPSVSWSGYLRDIAVDMNCPIIDLSKESYDFLYSLYGDNSDGVVAKNYNLTEVGGDSLHSSYAAAYKWASIVAGGLKNCGYENIINKDFGYTFTDTLGNEITCEVK